MWTAAIMILAALAPAGLARQRGERGQPPPAGPAAPPQNLQVLPKNSSPAEVLQIMQTMSEALGVQCGYCHVSAPAAAGGARGRAGRGDAAFDFAADDNPQKKAARQMMLMMRDINPKIVASVGKTAEATTAVSCVTCHRGVSIPKQLTAILDEVSAAKGMTAAAVQYRDLRKRYFGAQAYDFSERTLVTYAQDAIEANKPDDAIVWLQLNLEYYPLSSQTYAALSQAQQRKNDRDAAIKSQQRAVELDPSNADLKRQLERLKAR